MYKGSVFRFEGVLISDMGSYCLLRFPESLEEMPWGGKDSSGSTAAEGMTCS